MSPRFKSTVKYCIYGVFAGAVILAALFTRGAYLVEAKSSQLFDNNYLALKSQFRWSWSHFRWELSGENLNSKFLSIEKLQLFVNPFNLTKGCLPVLVKARKVHLKKKPNILKESFFEGACFSLDLQQLTLSDSSFIKQMAVQGDLLKGNFDFKVPIQLNQRQNIKNLSLSGGLSARLRGRLNSKKIDFEKVFLDFSLTEFEGLNVLSKEREMKLGLDLLFDHLSLDLNFQLIGSKMKTAYLLLNEQRFLLEHSKLNMGAENERVWTAEINFPSKTKFRFPLLGLSDRDLFGDLKLSLKLKETNSFQEISELSWDVRSDSLNTLFSGGPVEGWLSAKGRFSGAYTNRELFVENLNVDIDASKLTINNLAEQVNKRDSDQLLFRVKSLEKERSLFSTELVSGSMRSKGILEVLAKKESPYKMQWSFNLPKADLRLLNESISIFPAGLFSSGDIALEEASVVFGMKNNRIFLGDWSFKNIAYSNLEMNLKKEDQWFEEREFKLLEGVLYSEGVLSLSGKSENLNSFKLNGEVDFSQMTILWKDFFEKVEGDFAHASGHFLWSPEKVKVLDSSFRFLDSEATIKGVLTTEGNSDDHLKVRSQNKVNLETLRNLFPVVNLPLWEGWAGARLDLYSLKERRNESFFDMNNYGINGSINLVEASGVFFGSDQLWNSVNGQIYFSGLGWGTMLSLKNNFMKAKLSGETHAQRKNAMSVVDLFENKKWSHKYSLELNSLSKKVFLLQDSFDFLTLVKEKLITESQLHLNLSAYNFYLSDTKQALKNIRTRLEYSQKNLMLNPLVLTDSFDGVLMAHVNVELSDFVNGGRPVVLTGQADYKAFDLSNVLTVKYAPVNNFIKGGSGKFIFASRALSSQDLLNNFNGRATMTKTLRSDSVTKVLSKAMHEFFQQKEIGDYYKLKKTCLDSVKSSELDVAFYEGQWSLEKYRYSFLEPGTHLGIVGKVNAADQFLAKGALTVGESCFVRQSIPCIRSKSLAVPVEFELSGDLLDPEIALNFQENQNKILSCVDRSIASEIKERFVKDGQSRVVDAQENKEDGGKFYRLQKIFRNSQ